MIHDLLDTGLIQFGLFGEDERPIQLNFHLLPSYPDVLAQLADRAAATISEGEYDHLVCDRDSLPFGVAVSQRTAIPLVYSTGQPGVYDLVGAYDVGHPALLLANTWHKGLSALIEKAGRVGLDIVTTRVIASNGDIPSLIDLPEMVETLRQDGFLPSGQADAVQQWLVPTS